MRTDGWFAPWKYTNEFDEFYCQRKKEVRTKDGVYVSYSANLEVERLCYLILFGKSLDRKTCSYVCEITKACKQRESDFCRIKSISEKGDRYNDANFYWIYKRMRSSLEKHSITLSSILGEDRYLTFMSYLSNNALKAYKRYTPRERNEKFLEIPNAIQVKSNGLESIKNDPWEIFITNKIKEGDLKCLKFLDLGFLAS